MLVKGGGNSVKVVGLRCRCCCIRRWGMVIVYKGGRKMNARLSQSWMMKRESGRFSIVR